MLKKKSAFVRPQGHTVVSLTPTLCLSGFFLSLVCLNASTVIVNDK